MRARRGPGTIAILLLLAAAGAGAAGGGEEGATGMATDGNGAAPIRLLFIHHSCGGQLLAAPGPQEGGEPDSGERCIYVSHPNGGDLRARLADAGFEVHEASYGSRIGEQTDIHHWRRLFATRMDTILRCDRQDRLYPDDRTNRIVVFKSCYPNNHFLGRGREPGDPDAPELTLANARAAYRSLLPLFAERPEVLFVAFTAPPEAEPRPSGLRAKLKALFGRGPRHADLAREFNAWLAAPDGWLAGHEAGNVAVFDYYDILTGGGASNWSAYPTRGGRDSHPSSEGNRRAAEAFVPFLREAVDRLPAAGAS